MYESLEDLLLIGSETIDCNVQDSPHYVIVYCHGPFLFLGHVFGVLYGGIGMT